MDKKTKKIVLYIVSALILIGILAFAYFVPTETAVYVEQPSVAPTKTAQNVPEKQNTKEIKQTEKPKEITKESQEPVLDSTPPEFVVQSEETPKPEKKEEAPPKTTAPLPEENITEEKEDPMCTLTVRCDDLLAHMDKVPENKKDFIPADGMILAEQAVLFEVGESVFDVLKRVLKEQKIPMEYVQNPVFQSAYIEGIAQIYEFDCGDTSGWLYKVNGEKPNYGCSQYQVQKGDKIEFFYQCSLY